MFVRRLLLLLVGLLLASGLAAMALTALVIRDAVYDQVERAAENGLQQLTVRLAAAARELEGHRAYALSARRRQIV